tara:strand:- start:10574 stop:10735 length:162 start_codon:yes stop_codon:yes gene_type:complete
MINSRHDCRFFIKNSSMAKTAKNGKSARFCHFSVTKDAHDGKLTIHTYSAAPL